MSKPTFNWGSSDGKVPLIAFLAFFSVFKLGLAPLVTQEPSDICRSLNSIDQAQRLDYARLIRTQTSIPENRGKPRMLGQAKSQEDSTVLGL